MICSKCGAVIEEGANFCSQCGQGIPTRPAPSARPDGSNTGPQAAQPSAGQPPYTQQTAQPAAGHSQPTAQPPAVQPVYRQQTANFGVQPKPINSVPYLVWAIIVTVFACLPFGIVAIVYASKIDGAIYRGDINEAMRAANMSRIFSIVAGCIGGIVIIAYVFLVLGGLYAAFYSLL